MKNPILANLSGLIVPSRFCSNLLKNWSVVSSIVTWDHNENAIVEIGRMDGWDFRVGYKTHLSSHWRCRFYPKCSVFAGGCRLCFLIMYNNTRRPFWKRHLHYFFFPSCTPNIQAPVILHWRLVTARFKWGVSCPSVRARHSQNSTAWRERCGSCTVCCSCRRGVKRATREREPGAWGEATVACIRSGIRPSCQQTGWDQVS